jgi:hypothetical protein
MTAAEVKTAMSPTALNEVKANPQLFYPNPAKGEIRFMNAENSDLKVYDTMGKLALQQQITSSNQSVDINTLSQGVYIVVITDKFSNQQQNRLIVN